MKENIKGGVVYVTFASFDYRAISHCFSTRLGGVSDACFSSLNLARGRGDSDENVGENYERLCAALGFKTDDLAATSQIHGTKIERVKRAGAHGAPIRVGASVCKGAPCAPQRFADTDALISNDAGVVLVTSHADCAPIYLYDLENKAAGLAHAGWRGTLAEIGRKTVERMVLEFGSRPESVIAGIGPCICQNCFEVDYDVAAEFLPKFGEFAERRGEKYHIDLKGINREILINAGLLPENIEVAEECTCCDAARFYSHRRDGAKRGGHAAFLEV